MARSAEYYNLLVFAFELPTDEGPSDAAVDARRDAIREGRLVCIPKDEVESASVGYAAKLARRLAENNGCPGCAPLPVQIQSQIRKPASDGSIVWYRNATEDAVWYSCSTNDGDAFFAGLIKLIVVPANGECSTGASGCEVESGCSFATTWHFFGYCPNPAAKEGFVMPSVSLQLPWEGGPAIIEATNQVPDSTGNGFFASYILGSTYQGSCAQEDSYSVTMTSLAFTLADGATGEQFGGGSIGLTLGCNACEGA